MTITTTAVEVTYTADGIAVAFTVPFAFIANSHVLVYKNSVLQTSGYTLVGANTPSGGTIVFDIAPGAGAIIYLKRETPLVQDIDVVNNASIFASTLEVGLDYAAARQQEVAAELAAIGAERAATYVPCTITVVGTFWLFVPKPGYAVSALGVDQVFFGVAPADSPTSLGVKVDGINNTPGDERLVKSADGTTTVSTGDVLAGGLIAIYYHSVGTRAGLFQLVSGEIITGGGAGALFTKMTQTARTNNVVTMGAATGYTLPNNTGDGFLMAWEVPADGVADLSWLFNITGINGVDSYAVRYRDGTALPPTTPKAGDWLFFNRPGAAGGFFTIQDHWKAGTAQGGTDGGLSLYEQAGARGAAQRAATAERLARRVLTQPFGFETGAGGAVTQATSKSTGVTLNKLCGRITMNNASLGAGASVAFTLTNSEIGADDVVLVSIKSGATTLAYHTQIEATAAGSCVIALHRAGGGGALSEAVVLNFVVIKSVAA